MQKIFHNLKIKKNKKIMKNKEIKKKIILVVKILQSKVKKLLLNKRTKENS